VAETYQTPRLQAAVAEFAAALIEASIPPAPPPDAVVRLYTLAEARAALRVARSTFSKRIADGSIQTVCVGARRFVRSDVLQHLQSNGIALR
jgi:hypothetical protein